MSHILCTLCLTASFSLKKHFIDVYRTFIRQIALLVGVVVVAAGLAYMISKKSKKKGGGRKKLTVATASSSPKARKKIATGIGSVQTPSGRRSARIARKST